MGGAAGRNAVTYGDSNTTIVAPDDTDIVLSGSNDALTLGSGDTLLVSGLGNSVTGDSPAPITLANGSTRVDVAGAEVTATLVENNALPAGFFTGQGTIDAGNVGAEYDFVDGADYRLVNGDSFVELRIAGSARVLADAPGAHFSIDGLNDTVMSGAQSVVLSTIPPAGDQNIVDQIGEFSGKQGSGELVYALDEYADRTSAVVTPGSGAFGIYRQDALYNGVFGNGTLEGTIYDIVNGVSIYRPTAAALAGSIYASRSVTYSGEDGNGSYVSAINDYTDGTSAYVTPGNGLFGVYKNLTYYDRPDATGSVIQTTVDVFTGAGTGYLSISHFAANGAFGCYDVEVTTDGPEATGSVTRSVFDFFGGNHIVSYTLMPVAGDAGHESEVVTSGANGSGAITSTSIVASGTAANLFEAFAGFGLPAYTASPSVETADTASGSSLTATVKTLHADMLADFTTGSAAIGKLPFMPMSMPAAAGEPGPAAGSATTLITAASPHAHLLPHLLT